MERVPHLPKSRVARLAAVVNLLRDRKAPTTAATLAESLGVSERTVYRYIAELVAQGMPIHGEAGIGYVLRPGLFLPPVTLSEDEAEAVFFGLRLAGTRIGGAFADVIRRTLVRMHDVLSPPAREVFRYPAISVDSDGPSARNQVDLEPYLRAIRAHSRMAVETEVPGGRFKGAICPIGLRVSPSAIYLLAWYEKDELFVSLALADITSAKILDSRLPLSRQHLLQVWESARRLD